jgi:hypothetical protein
LLQAVSFRACGGASPDRLAEPHLFREPAPSASTGKPVDAPAVTTPIPRAVSPWAIEPARRSATGRQHSRRQLSPHEDLASHSMDGGAEDGEGSVDDQRGVHSEPSAIRALIWRKSPRTRRAHSCTWNCGISRPALLPAAALLEDVPHDESMHGRDPGPHCAGHGVLLLQERRVEQPAFLTL